MFPIIPKPRNIELKDGEGRLTRDDSGGANYEYVYDPDIPYEGYSLKTEGTHTVLRASSEAGAFYGETTLNVLDDMTGGAPGAFFVSDSPAYGYRAYMLDVARYFFDTDVVMKHIDYMALLKLNVLHLHLTDDQGWRVEIKKYPRLTEVGSHRRRTHIRFKAHGGYYTQEELKKIVAYAHARHIKVVPEIDFPGHFQAAIAAYPELGCCGEGLKVAENFGVKFDVACIGNPAVIEFMKDVLSELIPIFTDEYFHIGGDEVPFRRWEKCPKCLALKKSLGADSWHRVQAHVVNELADFLAEHGKTTITWNESEPTGVQNKNIVWQYWQGGLSEEKLAHEINEGRRVIMSPGEPFYLDLPYAINNVARMRAYKLVPDGVTAAENIIGVEFPLWTELVPDEKQADKMLFPRLMAGAEIAWRGSADTDIEERFGRYLAVLKRMGAKISAFKKEPRGFMKILDRIWWFRRQLYWGAVPNLIRNIKVDKILKKRNGQLKSDY